MITKEELLETINAINTVFIEASKAWEETSPYVYNQAKARICDISLDKDFYVKVFTDIREYSDFMNQKANSYTIKLTSLPQIKQARVKNINSINQKYSNYLKKRVNGEKGTISINKCFNDLYGLRIITDERLSLEEVEQILNNSNCKNCKCIDSSKNGYRAIHIYYKIDNNHYQWELQIWAKEDEDSNYQSHKLHKQEYTKWEILEEKKEEV